MTEQNSKSGNEQQRFSQEQYEMLKRCSQKRDMTEWNEWRREHKGEDILLEGAHLRGAYLGNANLFRANLKNASLYEAHLKDADLRLTDLEDADLFAANLEGAKLAQSNMKGAKLSTANLKGVEIWSANLENACLSSAHLENTNFSYAYLKGACFDESHLQGANFELAIVDGETSIWKPKVNHYCKNIHYTDFTGVALGSARIDPATKQLLEYNIRRMNWEDWYKVGPWWEKIPERLFVQPFWWMSNYGRSVSRIVVCFFGLAVLFALVYWLWPSCVMVKNVVGDIRGLWHALYFSVVTMTTLGFGDIAANPDSWWGQTLLMVQVILGYVLLGVLVTRFAVLFMAGGPAGKFADEKTSEIRNSKH